MYLRVPLYKYKSCSTYGYFCTNISFVTPTGDLNKYKSVISTSMCPTGDLNKYKYVISTSMCPMGDLNKYESAISTSRCLSLLYEFMKILISANEYPLLLYAYGTRVSMHVYIYKSCFPLRIKLSTGFNPCRYRGGRSRSSAYCWASTLVGVHHM